MGSFSFVGPCYWGAPLWVFFYGSHFCDSGFSFNVFRYRIRKRIAIKGFVNAATDKNLENVFHSSNRRFMSRENLVFIFLLTVAVVAAFLMFHLYRRTDGLGLMNILYGMIGGGCLLFVAGLLIFGIGHHASTCWLLRRFNVGAIISGILLFTTPISPTSLVYIVILLVCLVSIVGFVLRTFGLTK